MHKHEEDKRLVQELIATAEAMGQAMSPAAAALIVSDLDGVPFPAVQAALRSARANHKGRLTFSVIRERLMVADGRPDANEAWGLALLAQDERESVVWTTEIMWAFDAARPILRAGDKIGARMAFIAAYERLVAAAREGWTPAQWELSMGWDGERRAQALEQAVKLQRLPLDRALALGYDPAPQAITATGRAFVGLVTGAAVSNAGITPETSRRLQDLREQIMRRRDEREQQRLEMIERERKDLEEKKRRAAEQIGLASAAEQT